MSFTKEQVEKTAQSIDEFGMLLMHTFGKKPEGQRHFNENGLSEDEKASVKRLLDLKIIVFKSVPKESGFEYAYHWTEFGDKVMAYLGILNIKDGHYNSKVKKITENSKKIILVLIITLLTAGSAPWWWSPVINTLKKVQTESNTFPGDPSRTINESVFDVIKNINQLSTDIERQSSVKKYYGLGTRVNPSEFGRIVNTQPQDSGSFVKIQSYDDGTLTLICEFDSKWNQKLLLLGSSDVYFWGRIKDYDINKSSLILTECSLSR